MSNSNKTMRTVLRWTHLLIGWSIGVFQAKALRRLEGMNPSELTPSQLLQYLLEATRLERLARGEPEKIKESREKIEHPSDIDYDEVARRAGLALQRLIERNALGKPVLKALEGGKGLRL